MKRSRVIVGLALIAVALMAGCAWFLPLGTGEYMDSPDGRYTASASNLDRGTWLHGRVSYVEIKIVEKSTGKVIWNAKRYPATGEVPPDFGDRSKKVIVWAADSKTVSVPVGGKSDAVWAVP